MTGWELLLEQIDEQWKIGAPPDLKTLLVQVPADEGALRVELCAADLEWRWRTEFPAESLGADSRPSLPEKPKASDYRELLADHWDDMACRRNLLEAEWCARSLWGDPVDVDEFAQQLPSESGWSERLSQQLHGFAPLDATLQGQTPGDRPRVFRVSQEFVIGRQQKGEPAAPAWVQAEGRLIVAGRSFRDLSREQFRVRRTKLLEVEVTNLSKNEVQFVDSTLLPQAAMRIDLPFEVEAGTLKLAIDRCRSHVA